MRPFNTTIGAILLAFATLGACVSGMAQPVVDTKLEAMPRDLETTFALSALPPPLRDGASVYVLDPAKGYALSRQGKSGLACLVERTDWALADYRNDIYFALCFDAAGTGTYMKMIMDAAALRAGGLSPDALKKEIEARWKSRTYAAPARAGLSYMVSPIMRTIGPPDLQVHTMSMPHLMFYAPNVTNEDIGAKPDLNKPESLLMPFIDRQGADEHSYVIQLVGAAEKAEILAREQQLVRDLCRYRQVLCVGPHGDH